MSYQHGMSVIKIAYADNDKLLQDLLPTYIDGIENCKVVIQANTGNELLMKLSLKPDTNLIIMDLTMPEMDGIDAAKSLKKKFPEIKILFLSIYENDLVYCRVINAGGNGFLCKNSSFADFRKAIFEVMRNEYYFPKIVSSNGMNKLFLQGKKNCTPYVVSEEEIHFLRLICSDLTYEAIACKMGTNLRRIDYIRQGLFEKFNVRNRTGLALYAYSGSIYT